MELNNREISLIFWVSLFLVYAILKAKPWEPLRSLLSILWSSQIRIVFGSITLYVLSSVLVLQRLNLWEPSNIKTTIFWFFGFCIIAFFQAKDAGNDDGHFSTLVREAIGVNAIIAFVSNSFVFILPVELALTPLTLLASAALAVAERTKNGNAAKSAMTSLLILIGGSYLIYSCYRITVDFQEIANQHVAREFFVPILLTLLFVPFLYGWHIFLSYESAFSRIRFLIKDAESREYAKKKMLLSFHIDTRGLRQWLRHTAVFRPSSVTDIDSSIAEIKRNRKRQLNPFRVPPHTGWLPEHALRFLSDEGLSAKEYCRSYDCWHASSPHLKLDSSLFQNSMSYHISGNEFSVTSICLTLTVENRESENLAVAKFEDVASKLVGLAAYGKIQSLPTLRYRGYTESFDVGDVVVTLKKSGWLASRFGYELEVLIEPRPGPVN